MLRLGLTGGIASGKSAVAAMLREIGFAVLDADSLAHRLIERVQLANVVFADRAKLDRLNAIVHPRVADVVFRQFDEWERNGVRDAAFVEAALLIEASLDKKLDGLIVAWCKPEQQLERLVARGLTEAEARRR